MNNTDRIKQAEQRLNYLCSLNSMSRGQLERRRFTKASLKAAIAKQEQFIEMLKGSQS
jgi:hypothetical protein